MKLEIASWNDGGTAYNALAEEGRIISFSISQEFDNPAECTIILSDADGALFQKYNVDANDVYIGPGKVELEHPTATDLFLGRIIRSNHNTREGKTTLVCRDWMHQLTDERIDYDMREDLSGGLRQSEVKSDVGDETLPVSQTFIYAKALDGAAYTTETTAANDDTADDMHLLPAVPAVNDAYLFGFDTKQGFLNLNISTAGVGVWTITWEFYGVDVDGEACGDAEWLPLTGLTDGTNGFTVAGTSTISWTIPSLGYWLSCTIDSLAKYWIRGRVSVYTSIATQPLGKQANQPQILYDDDLTFDADEFNGKYLIFPAEAAGAITVLTGPYADTVAGTEIAGSFADVWLDDTNFHSMTRSPLSLTVDYDYHVNAELGSLFSAGPTAGKIYLTCIAYTDLLVGVGEFYIKVKSAAENYYTIMAESCTTTTTTIRRFTIDIPTQYLTAFVDTLGEVTIQIEVPCGGTANAYLDVYQCLISLDYTMIGTSEAYLITDTTPNEIHTVANLTYNGLGIYEGCKYCVVRPIYKHIDSAEGGILITGGDLLVALTCAATIEHTTGMSTRNYQGRTRHEILQDLNKMDKAVIWCTLGTTIITRKRTFNSGAPTALTDATVLSWANCEYNYETIKNEYDVYGIRIGDEQLHTNTGDLVPDPGADSKSTYGVTRSDVLRSTGTLSQYETDELGKALVERDEDVLLTLVAELAGLDSTYRLGTEVAITSTRLGLTAINYVVTHWNYDSARNRSTIRLHPRSSIGYQEYAGLYKEGERIQQGVKSAKIDTYSPALSTQDW